MIISVKAHLLLLINAFLLAFLPSIGSAQTVSAPFCLYEAPLSFFAPVASIADSEAVEPAMACPAPEANAEPVDSSDSACWLTSASLAADRADFELASAYLSAYLLAAQPGSFFGRAEQASGRKTLEK